MKKKLMKVSLVFSCFVVLVIFAGCNQNTTLPDTTTGRDIDNPEVTSATDTTGNLTGPHTYTVEVKDMKYMPESLSVNVGDTVVWINEDSVSHTVTSSSGDGISSSVLAMGDSYNYTFNTSGIFRYHCSIHPEMEGEVNVQ